MKKICLLIVLISNGALWAQMESKSETVYFESASHTLLPQAQELILNTLNDVPRDQIVRIGLYGHTDDMGTDSYNVSLSERRVRSVADFLESKGISKVLIEKYFFGERKPISNNLDSADRSSNRRVEIEIEYFQLKNTENLNAFIQHQNATFAVFPNEKGTLIVCKQGTKILVPSNAFVDAEGNTVESNVYMQIDEALDYKSMIAHGLSTLSEGIILQTGGMLRLGAQDDAGNELQLQSNLQIIVPTENEESGMTVFTSESGDNWTNTRKPVQNDFNFEFNEIQPFFYPVLDSIPQFRYSGPPPPMAPRKFNSPRKPLPPIYKAPKINWYTWNKKAMQEKAKQEQQKANAKYELNLGRYHERLNAYEQNEIMYPKLLREYEAELTNYWQNRQSDSLAFMESEEVLNIYNMNKIAYENGLRNHEINYKAWLERKRIAMNNYVEEKRALGLDVSNEFTAFYVMNVSDLGWINIDKFYNTKERDMMFVEIEKVDQDAKVQLIFNNIKSVLSCNVKPDGNVVSPSFPKNQPAEIFAYKVKEGKVWVAKESVKSKKVYRLNYKEVTMEELGEMLSKS